MRNDYEFSGEQVKVVIPFRNNTYETLISKDDFALVDEPEGYWRMQYIGNNPYVYYYQKLSAGKYQRIYLHRLLMDKPDKLAVDHINHNTLDNRRENLRIVTIAENVYNKPNKKKYHVFQDGIYRCRCVSRDIKIDKRFKSKKAAEKFGEKMNELLMITDER